MAAAMIRNFEGLLAKMLRIHCGRALSRHSDFVIPRVVAQSSNPGLRAFYRLFWMLRLRAA